LIGDIASIATAVGVLAAVAALRQAQRQRLRQFEDTYVARYWNLMDRLSLSVLRADGHGPPDEHDERVIRAYFQLCEDELELRKTGWISDATWRIWADGIRWQMQPWPFDELWRTITESDGHHEPPFAHLRDFMIPAMTPATFRGGIAGRRV
jgi:hypothetical protein